MEIKAIYYNYIYKKYIFFIVLLYMSGKLICTLLLILFIILILLIINRKIINCNKIENFADKKEVIEEETKKDPTTKSSVWTTDKDVLADEKKSLNDVQKTEVTNMINAISESKLKSLISSQSPLLVGPRGPQGIQGPSGTTLIASGRLINKSGSFDKVDGNNNYLIPKYVVTRTEGTSPTSSLSFMDDTTPFAPFQNWQLDINNNLKNRYDGNCLTMGTTDNKLYIDTCSDNPNQKWNWDNSNRIISTSNSNNTDLKCIGLSNPERNVLTTNVPGCTGDQCQTNTARRYLSVKECEINNIHEDEVWSFV
jgi:hypothetical protein